MAAMKDFLERVRGTERENYPAIVLNRATVFPYQKISLVIDDEKAIRSVARSAEESGLVVFLIKINGGNSQIGIVAQIGQEWELAPGIVGLLAEGIRRVKIISDFMEGDVRRAEVIGIEENHKEKDGVEIEALARTALDSFKKVIQDEGLVPLMMIEDLQKQYLPPERASDLISAVLRLDFPDKLKLLEELDLKKRLEFLNIKLKQEMSIAKTEAKIQSNMEKELDDTQKEFILREKLKAIEKELGETDGQEEYILLERKIIEADLPEDSRGRVLSELHRLRQMPAMSAEIPYIRNYLEWIADLPWSKKDQVEVDLIKAKQVLDKDHYGLEKTKERVMEYLAVQKLTGGKGKGNILCFVGPPGTGKTSVGQSIAEALGRKFVRISLGGIRDEAEVRGFRRTYVGSMPGRIIQGMRTAKTKNPVFMMDEIDKLGADFRGDPAAALLEVLDPAQNNSFSDHYIEIPFDLSEVFFITTANILDPIPPALRDRMEVIEFTGYTNLEKFHIAKDFLIPRVLESNGLSKEKLIIDNAAVKTLIASYTREAGVRELERKLSEIARKVVLYLATMPNGKSVKTIKIKPPDLEKYLGPKEFEETVREESDEVGVATGLAWTPFGGEILFIEANCVPGRGNLMLTGQLGDQMQESAKAGLSYLRGKSKELKFAEDFYYKTDIHVHVPSGAVPKDGPSAGIAIATALASMLTNRKVKKEVALTGEVTLSGKVLPIGGVKEKVMAAERAGVKTVVLPLQNKKNLTDIPEEARKNLDFKFVKHMDGVLNLALI